VLCHGPPITLPVPCGPGQSRLPYLASFPNTEHYCILITIEQLKRFVNMSEQICLIETGNLGRYSSYGA
jgi:hypothetical protein